MPTWALLIPGLASFLVPYLPGFIAAVIVLSDGAGGDDVGWLFVPAVGAFYWAGEASNPDDVALFAAMGISELAGIALITAGIAINHRDGDTEVSLSPLVGPSLTGLAVGGRF